MFLSDFKKVDSPPREKKKFYKGCKECDCTGIISFFDPKKKYDRESFRCDCELGRAHRYVDYDYGILFPTVEQAESRGLKRVKDLRGNINFN